MKTMEKKPLGTRLQPGEAFGRDPGSDLPFVSQWNAHSREQFAVAFVLLDSRNDKAAKGIARSKRKSDPSAKPCCTAVVMHVVETGIPYVVSNVQTEKDTSLVDTLKVLKIESVMCIPLRGFASGPPFG